MLRSVLIFAAVAVAAALAFPRLAERAAQSAGNGPAAMASADTPDTATPAQVALRAGPDGHYRTAAAINGRMVEIMVDTGATAVALTFEDARSLGLVAPGDRFDVPVRTANGTAHARRVRLDSVRIGGATVRDVEALVGQPGMLSSNLLGMSYLGRLRRFEMRDGRLVLEM